MLRELTVSLRRTGLRQRVDRHMLVTCSSIFSTLGFDNTKTLLTAWFLPDVLALHLIIDYCVTDQLCNCGGGADYQ